MLSKIEIKYIQSLYHKKQRQLEGLFIAEGPKVLSELLLSDYTVQKIYATEDWVVQNRTIQQPIITVSNVELQRISNLQTANQAVAIVSQKIITEDPLFANKITLVLDGIQDPGNLGTIIRIADWFGITQIICSQDTVELYNPKVVQSTMGSFMRLNVFYENLAIVLSKVSIPILGTFLAGASIYTIAKPNEAILVIGSEGNGISEAVLPFITNKITIPKIGGAESLNAAVATGIIISHLV